jgi:hypothetical protein
MYRRRHSSILDTFLQTYYDIEQYVVFANLGKDWQEVNTAAQKFEKLRFNLRKLNELEVRTQ